MSDLAPVVGDFYTTPLMRRTAIVSGSIFAWRWGFQMQAVNMSDQLSFRGPSTEVEAQHLIRPLSRCSSDPQAHQQARNKGCRSIYSGL